MDADSDRSARQKLRREGVYLTELVESGGSVPAPSEERAPRFSLSFIRRIPGSDLALATRQLATLLGAGIPLVESLGDGRVRLTSNGFLHAHAAAESLGAGIASGL